MWIVFFVDRIEVVEDVVYIGMSGVVYEEDITHVSVLSCYFVL
jgi:hypothetical protein